jgi:hypothetical protein
MKNLILALFLILTFNSFSQNVKGKIFGANKSPLFEANIYFDGTTIKTTSDENGDFTLNFDAEAKNSLVVSSAGYQTEYISNFDINKELKIYLKPIAIVLKEVVILNVKSDFTRMEKLQLFREQFLGLTPNGKETIIQNEEDIYFKYDKGNYTLTAYSDSSLIILNPSLGYKIEYNLVSFEVQFSKFKLDSDYVIKSFYRDFSNFEEISNTNERVSSREKAYNGSEINFFRNLKNNIWGNDQFLLMVNDRNVSSSDCFKVFEKKASVKIEVIPQQADVRDLKAIASYDIVYDKDEYSNITFETKDFNIYKYGNYSNVKNIILTGKIAKNRMGDMLPLNYNLN